MAEPIEMPFGIWTRVGPKKHVRDGSKSPCEGVTFRGKGNFNGELSARLILELCSKAVVKLEVTR